MLLATVALVMVDTLLLEALGIDLGLTPLVDVAFGAAVVIWSVALGLAVLRYRLFDVDMVLNRTIVYGTLTAALLTTYVLVVAGVGVLLPDAGGDGVAVVATGLVALAFDPARRRVQAIVCISARYA